VPKPPFDIEFYEDREGDQPVRRWLKEELTPRQRRAIGYAMSEVLQELGLGVCGTEFGKQLGGGLFEFRLRRDLEEITPSNSQGQPERSQASAGTEKLLLRVFCHAHGEKLILLLAGYDKGRDPSPRTQRSEIALARKRLAEWKREARLTADVIKPILK
jgi:phage-related protein